MQGRAIIAVAGSGRAADAIITWNTGMVNTAEDLVFYSIRPNNTCIVA